MAEDDPDARAVPPATTPGRGRDLSRVRRSPKRGAETGRRHHIGAAPALMPLWKPDGTVTTTRTSAAQLIDLTDAQLERLAATVEREMIEAAAALDFEQAAHLRDELDAARAAIAARAGG